MFAIRYAPNWQSNQLIVVAMTAGVTNRPVLLKALFAIPCNAASALPARAFFNADKELTYPASSAKAATLARPMTRHRMKGSWKKVGGSFSDIAGARRWGTSDRVMCAVTTRTEAMPRKPYRLELALEGLNGRFGIVSIAHTSAQTTSLFPAAGGGIVEVFLASPIPSKLA